jgi:hypothetical protein
MRKCITDGCDERARDQYCRACELKILYRIQHSRFLMGGTEPPKVEVHPDVIENGQSLGKAVPKR